MTDNPFLKAYLDVQRASDYAEVMRGIGHVTVAMSFAEFVIDMLGWHLTGDLAAYQAKTKRMPIGAKTRHVEKLGNECLTDSTLRQRVTHFCDRLRALLCRRNDAVHSLYFEEKARVFGVKLPIGTKAMKPIMPSEFSELADQVCELLGDNNSLVRDVEGSLVGGSPGSSDAGNPQNAK